MFLQLLLGWVYCHIGEYFIHKNVLHNPKRFKIAFKTHFKNHHRAARVNNDMIEPKYSTQSFSDLFFDKELRMIVGLLLLHLPVVFFFPWFYVAMLWSGFMYYFLHRVSHEYPNFAGRFMPWHVAHHLDKNQNINWGVRLPFVDFVLGTSNYSMWKNWSGGNNDRRSS
jgi:hypothetical protein